MPQIEAFRRENTGLIESLVSEQVDRVRDVLVDSGAGTRVEEIAKAIRESTDATRSRAALIARDQVLKLNANVAQARHEAAGVTSYIWRTARDERVREDHRVLTARASRRAAHRRPAARRASEPGEHYQCRCVAEPIIPGFDE